MTVIGVQLAEVAEVAAVAGPRSVTLIGVLHRWHHNMVRIGFPRGGALYVGRGHLTGRSTKGPLGTALNLRS